MKAINTDIAHGSFEREKGAFRWRLTAEKCLYVEGTGVLEQDVESTHNCDGFLDIDYTEWPWEWKFKDEIESIVIGEGITEITYEAFNNYANVKAVQLPESLTAIGDRAFFKTAISEIRIPDNVRSVGAAAFYMTNIPCMEEDEVYIDGWLLHCSKNVGKVYRVRPGTKGIAKSTFDYFYSGIEDLYIPGTVRYIGYNATSKKIKRVYLGAGCPNATSATFGAESWGKLPEVIRCGGVIPWEDDAPAWNYSSLPATGLTHLRAKAHPKQQRLLELLQYLKDGAYDEAASICCKHDGKTKYTPESYRKFTEFTIAVDIENMGKWAIESLQIQLNRKIIKLHVKPTNGLMCCMALGILNELEALRENGESCGSVVMQVQIPDDLARQDGFLALQEILRELFPWITTISVKTTRGVSEYLSWYRPLEGYQKTCRPISFRQPAAETPKQPAAETPKQSAAETPKQPAAETPKQSAAETPKQPAAETPKQPAAETPKQSAAEAPKQSAAEAPKQSAAEAPKKKRVGLLGRLFGGGDGRRTLSPIERFYDEMNRQPVFRTAFACATAEVTQGIMSGLYSLKGADGTAITMEQWQAMEETKHLEVMLVLGNRHITAGATIRVQQVEKLPYCLAVTLMYLAYTGQHENQLLDIEPCAEDAMFKQVLKSLQTCLPRWQYRLYGM